MRAANVRKCVYSQLTAVKRKYFCARCFAQRLLTVPVMSLRKRSQQRCLNPCLFSYCLRVFFLKDLVKYKKIHVLT